MGEISYQVIICGPAKILEANEVCIPLPCLYVTDVSSLEYRVTNSSKVNESRIKRYFILLLESIGEDADEFYSKMEENAQVLWIFTLWAENSMPSFKQTKLCYIPKESITSVITLSYIQILKNEADKQVKLDQISLAKNYLRKAEKTKEWIMANLRAEPCHILVIPLNTDSINLMNTIRQLQQYCAKFGYSSAIVRALDDYIPKSEVYDKLPYGKLLFEYEDPKIICRWIRLLSPIRMYLYGNEQIIPYEWSKQMILYESDHTVKRIVNDDDWHTFIENEPVSDQVKWNFSSKHAETWNITQFMPMKLDSLGDNIRFRSALRRAHITYSSRMSTVTAQIFQWFDECLEYGYIKNEFKLTRLDKPIASQPVKDGQEHDTLALKHNRMEDANYSITINDKARDTYSYTQILNQSNEMVNYYSNKSDRIYIWLDNEFYIIDQRFQTLIYPNQWKHFSDVDQCQTYILNQQLQYNPRIYLLSSYYLAEPLFTYGHVSKVFVAYLYSNQTEIFSKWMNSFPVIRGIYKNLDALYEQFDYDIRTNTEFAPYNTKQQENEEPLPISFYDIDQDDFRRHRVIIEILLKLPRTLEAKQEMIDELRGKSLDNEIFSKQINDFEENYHSNAAIQWYTRDSCLYRLINRALRHDIELVIKYRFFIIDLYQKLEELHQQIINLNNYSEQTLSTYYRGQLMSSTEIDQFKEHIGSLISINTFFSTTSSLDIALMFAGGSTLEGLTSNKPIIFSIEVNSTISNTRPYANINFYSAYEEEEEVLFALGSVFRIEKVDLLTVNDDVQVIHLKMIDEKDLPQDDTIIDISQLLPEQKFLDPIYALVGVTSLFQMNEQAEDIKSRLEDVDVQFFDNIDDLEHYTRTMKAVQSFVIFIHSELHMPERYQQTRVLSYHEYDMHFNDLIYQLLYEMEHHNKPKERIKDLYMSIATVYRPSDDNNFYVQLLLSSPSKQKSEEELRAKLPSSTPLITFYQIDSCINFLKSIAEPDRIGKGILILQSDEADIDNTIDRFESINSINFIYICSNNAFNIPYRRIIHGKFLTENDLYGQLYSDNLYTSFSKVNQQIDLPKNKAESDRYLQQTEHFYELLRDHHKRDRDTTLE